LKANRIGAGTLASGGVRLAREPDLISEIFLLIK
jgi:hypothetical protein